MRAFARVWLLRAIAVAALASGCGGEPTASVTGMVTDAAGMPVSTGFILFTPQDPAKYREAAEVPIVEGRFDLRRASVGPKFVSIVITRNGRPIDDVTPSPSDVDLVPGSQVIDFTLSKQKERSGVRP